MWATERSADVAGQNLNISRKAVYQHYRYIRDICSWKLINSPELQIAVYITNRSAQTLIILIEKHVKPGSEIWT